VTRVKIDLYCTLKYTEANYGVQSTSKGLQPALAAVLLIIELQTSGPLLQRLCRPRRLCLFL
jgi:hypothetical protein